MKHSTIEHCCCCVYRDKVLLWRKYVGVVQMCICSMVLRCAHFNKLFRNHIIPLPRQHLENCYGQIQKLCTNLQLKEGAKILFLSLLMPEFTHSCSHEPECAAFHSLAYEINEIQIKQSFFALTFFFFSFLFLDSIDQIGLKCSVPFYSKTTVLQLFPW